MPALREALAANDLWPKDQAKPHDPKATVDWALQRAKKPRSSSLYRELAGRVTSATVRTEPSFGSGNCLWLVWWRQTGGVGHGNQPIMTGRYALDLLKGGLGPFVERELTSAYQARARSQAADVPWPRPGLLGKKPLAEWDAASLLKLMWEAWNDVFRRTLGPAERSLVSELRDHRNKWAHQETFSSDDAYRGPRFGCTSAVGRVRAPGRRHGEDEDGAPADPLSTSRCEVKSARARARRLKAPLQKRP